MSTRLPKPAVFYLDNPNLLRSCWKPHCFYPMMTMKWLTEKEIQTGSSERQTLWPPTTWVFGSGRVTVLFVLFYFIYFYYFLSVTVSSHSSAAFHIEVFRYIILCTLFLTVRFSLISSPPSPPTPPPTTKLHFILTTRIF